MWLINSSVGRKVVMSLTGLFLILFVTFHAVMNAVALISFEAYEKVCEFLGANWYALLGTAAIAGGAVLHIIYAFWLSMQNKKARGGDAYAVAKRPKNVEWASQNMLVLGIIVFCFFVLHLYHFWAKMQLPEMMGDHPLAGKAALEAVFGQVWVLPVYLVCFVALWFHLTHGFWSAFQSLGTANEKWICRFKCIGFVWSTVVMGLFAVEAIYFTWFFAF
ncbi:succinate dehydrogenase cytochrome b subunit [Sodaliphilus sp.]|uniref:succinate dehydrogenase cytochrome b subunit n=1 Tax=Sodaliphilus sp. TaxID=2815818 RepID=UPI003890CD88